MQSTVLIIEARREVAAALEELLAAANLASMVVPHLEKLSDVEISPAAILVRIAFESVSDPPHAAIARLPPGRPPVVAIAWEEDEVTSPVSLRDVDASRAGLTFVSRGFALPRREVLLRAGTLLGQLAHDFGSEPGGFRQDVVQPLEHLLELFWINRGAVVRHSFRKDYRWRWHP